MKKAMVARMKIDINIGFHGIDGIFSSYLRNVRSIFY